MKRLLVGLILGFLIKLGGVEIANLRAQWRWNACVQQMGKTLPMNLPGGQHYCLGTVFQDDQWSWFDIVMRWQPNFYSKYEDLP